MLSVCEGGTCTYLQQIRQFIMLKSPVCISCRRPECVPRDEDSPDSTPPARALRSMQTGQNSIASENSLPQLGQVRWGSALMDLPVLRRSDPKTTPRSTEWCESGQHGPWQTVVPFHKLVCSIICAASSNRNKKHQTHRGIRRRDILNRTRI